MPLKNDSNNVRYLRIRDGKFYEGKDKENPFGELEGRIVNMRFKDEEYEGTPVRKLIVVLDDGADRFQVSFNTESQNYSTFISFLKGVDVNGTITLHPKLEVTNKDGKEVKRNSVLVSQDGTYAKGYFTKDNKHGAPEWKVVKVGAKKVTDKSDYLAFMEGFVTENYINKLQNVPAVAKEAVAETADVEQEDQLPWNS